METKEGALMKILVIGGAGYIGSHVARALLDQGHSVTVYDNLSTGRPENLFEDETFVKGDILDYPALLETMGQGFDGLVHLAAFKAAGESMIAPEKYSLNNLSGTVNILNAASQAGIRLFVFSSSAAVYGEPEYLPIDENHPTEPVSYYGFTKLEIERCLGWYERLRGIRFAALRYFNAAGYDPQGRIRGIERGSDNLLPVVMEAAIGLREKIQIFGDDYKTRDGTGLRDYIHVTDLAEAHIAALDYLKREDTSLTVNLGSDSGVTVKEMVEAAREITGRPIRADVGGRRAGDPAAVYASSARAQELLCWNARYSDVKPLISSAWDVYRSVK